MKRIIAVMLALLMVFSLTAAFAEEEPAVSLDHLKVGNPTPMRGDFFTGMWGNASSDMDVRDLLHGYNVIRWDGENGMFATDPSVVSELIVTESEEGDRDYILVLQNDLMYSDGTRITAWDYAFSILMEMSPVISELGGKPETRDYILGSKEYQDGSATVLAGVKVPTEDTLEITLSHEALPFFYEMGLLSCNPYPIKVLAPDATVKDDGDGVYLDGAISADAVNSYRSNPTVVSGPYTLTSWDGTTAEFEINPNYKGNYAEQKPTIQTLTYTSVKNEEIIAQLQSGEFGLINKAMRADVIADGMTLMGEGGIQMATYPRSGLSYIRFNLDQPTVASKAVRQAIAWCMDRDEIIKEYTGDNGLRVDGYYGIGQWMYGIVSGTIAPPITPPENEKDQEAQKEYEEALEKYGELTLENLTAYTLDTAKAAELLDGDGWTLNADGIREKDGTALSLTLLIPEGNTIGATFEKYLKPNLEEVGIKLEIETVPMAELLSVYYGQSDKAADMIFLASNFELVFDPTAAFTGNGNEPVANADGEALYNLAKGMNTTEAGDVLSYMQNWVAFQERFNESLPMIPIYGNVYFDFYTDYLQEYAIMQNSSWSQAIVGAYLAEPVEEEEAEEAGEEVFEP